MSTQQESHAELQKKRKAGVTFTCKKSGKLDKSAIPNDDYKSHYLYPSDTKSDSSYPVVDSEGCLRKGNVSSAYQLGARGGVSEDSLHSKLRKLNKEWPEGERPIDFDDDKQSFTKHAEIAKTDAARRVVVGVAMEPDAVDTQGDFERAETIEVLSEGYMERLAAGDAYSGVMHSTFPSGNILSHVENRVLSESEHIGGTEYPAGTWQIGVKVRDDTLWRLITETETLTGFSIGGHVHETVEHGAESLPDDVRIDDELREAAVESDEPLREITDATIHEISLVDIPAVQRAQIQVAKSDDDLAKGAAVLTESVEAATEYLVQERGHERGPARELAEFLNREKTAMSSDDDSWIGRAKRFFTRGDGSESTVDERAEPRQDTVTIETMTSEFNDDEQDALKQFINTELMDDGGDDSSTDTKAIDALSEQLDAIETKLDEQDGDESDEKSEDGDEDSRDEMIERLAANQEQMADLLKQMASAQGVSQQADLDSGTEQADEPSEKAKFLGLAGVGAGAGGGR